jgi:FAD/FMN-containing dehydrogenase/Fe-S oxidoreductase
VRYAAEHQLSLVPRGAGTGLAGESLGPGIVVDVSTHLRAVGEIGGDTVRVQPGVVYRELNSRLAKLGRRFAPDPTSGVQCTIGGMLATNASGAHALLHGYTRDHVVQLRVVLSDGESGTAGRETYPIRGEGPAARLQTIAQQVGALIEQHAELIERCRPRTRYDRCGYALHDVLTEDGVDVARLLVGSEGTLAFFTEATLRTIPLPVSRSVVLLGFASLEDAVRATQQVLPTRPAACDLLDRRLVTLARGKDAEVRTLIPSECEAVLLIEYESDSTSGAADSARQVTDAVYRTGRRAGFAVTATESDEIERLWNLRETVLPSLYGLRDGPQPVAFVEDVGVPAEELGTYLHRVQQILRRRETTASFLVHAGTGQVHTRPFLDLRQPEHVSRLWALAEEIHCLALELGGTVSTQHGTGLARTPWVARQYGVLYPVFRELKSIFDPHQILNPGKIIGPDPGMPAWPLRPIPQKSEAAPVLRWPANALLAETLNCNGCGHCRSQSHTERMCPIFRVSVSEAATPRAKANLLRFVLDNGGEQWNLSSDAVREVADLCVNCRMCATECPAQVNIPKLMLEAKAANTSEHGMDRTDWALARTEGFAALGSRFAGFINAGLASGTVRWLLEKFLGVSRKRRLPRFASRSFLDHAARKGWTRRPGNRRPRVAYFVDVFANYNDPDIAEATVAVLHHNGIEVYVPPDQRGCGMAALAYGDVDSAREVAEHNVRILAELARDGFAIVCSEPTAGLMLQQDYANLLDDPETRLVADKTIELTSYLGTLHAQGKLRTDFASVQLSVGHHVPCHLKALGRPPAGPGLLALVPGLNVQTIDVSCSGMAGTFGLSAKNYELSLQAGRPMLDELRRPRVLFGSTECSTCRLQMENGSGKRTLHPVQYLALAYGLMPQLAERLRGPMQSPVLQ